MHMTATPLPLPQRTPRDSRRLPLVHAPLLHQRLHDLLVIRTVRVALDAVQAWPAGLAVRRGGGPPVPRRGRRGDGGPPPPPPGGAPKGGGGWSPGPGNP